MKSMVLGSKCDWLSFLEVGVQVLVVCWGAASFGALPSWVGALQLAQDVLSLMHAIKGLVTHLRMRAGRGEAPRRVRTRRHRTLDAGCWSSGELRRGGGSGH